MKTLTLTDENNDILVKLCAAGAMRIEENAQQVIHDCMGMLRMKERGHYPDREDKEIILKNMETAERAASHAVKAFTFVRDHELVADDPEQKQAIEDIIARNEKFLNEDLVKCKTGFDEVFALMENPDYNPKDYLKAEESETDPEGELRKLMEMLGMDPNEMNESKQNSEDSDTPESSEDNQ